MTCLSFAALLGIHPPLSLISSLSLSPRSPADRSASTIANSSRHIVTSSLATPSYKQPIKCRARPCMPSNAAGFGNERKVSKTRVDWNPGNPSIRIIVAADWWITRTSASAVCASS